MEPEVTKPTPEQIQAEKDMIDRLFSGLPEGEEVQQVPAKPEGNTNETKTRSRKGKRNLDQVT